MESQPQFDFGLPTRIIFGSKASLDVGRYCSDLGASRALVVIDPGVQASGIADQITASLSSDGVSYEIFADVKPNPLDSDIEKGAVLAKSVQIILGIGGGSSLDTAKGIGILASNGGDIRDYNGNDNVPGASLPVICIPTTAGTGSEVTGNISVTNRDSHEKMAIRSRYVYPHMAILDPTLLLSLPSSVAASAGMDALVHALETYTSTRANCVSKMFSREAAMLIGRSLERFVTDRRDAEAAVDMSIGSCLAGVPLYHTGTGAAHAIARSLGGRFNLPHGATCGTLIEPIMRFNLDAAYEGYSELAIAMGLVGDRREDDYNNAQALIEEIHRIRVAVGLQEHLSVTTTDEELKDLARWSSAQAGPNPRPLSTAEAEDLLVAVISS